MERRLNYTVSHFKYAPLITFKITQKNICYIYSETISIKRIYICISPINSIVIRWVTREKMDREGHYPQNTFHIALLEWNSDHIALFSGSNFCNARDKSRFLSWQYLRLEYVCYIYHFLNVLLFWFPADQGLKKNITVFKVSYNFVWFWVRWKIYPRI